MLPKKTKQRLVPTTNGRDDADANANTGAAAGEKSPEASAESVEQQQQQQQHQQYQQRQERLRQLTGHKRLAAAWFGEDGAGSVSREAFAAFVRDLRLDVKTVECRLYSRAM